MSRITTVTPSGELVGEVNIPGDKSISHRSVMLGSLADKPIRINNFLFAEDCCSTISCMQALGAEITRLADNSLSVKGNGLYGLKEPAAVLDAGNSGTTIRLLTGLLGAQPFMSILTGDNSLRRRPMGRVITPLKKMGCSIRGRDSDRYAPLAILPAETVNGIEYNMPVASAQVKSAVLLAGLFANSPTQIIEPVRSRDHTELMLEAFGVSIERGPSSVLLVPPTELTPPSVLDVPGDISSAAFWLVAASIIPGSRLRLVNVGMNSTRTGIVDVLVNMGADIQLLNQRVSGQEPVADIDVRYAPLRGTSIEADIIPRLIDEIPILAVAALAAEGRTVIKDAGELRVKETDRLSAITKELTKMGAVIQETADGIIVNGSQTLAYAECDSHHDHRIAMMLAVAGAAAKGVSIANSDCVSISYPNFYEELCRLASCVEETR